MRLKLGDGKPAEFVRKAGVESVLRLSGSQRQAFLDELRTMVDYITELGIKAQAFAHFYLLHTLDQNRDIGPILFEQPFFHSMHPTGEWVRDHDNQRESTCGCHEVFRNVYRSRFGQGATCTVRSFPYGHARQNFAVEFGTAFRKSLSERFERNITNYFMYEPLDDIRLRQLAVKDAKRLAPCIYSRFARQEEQARWPKKSKRQKCFNRESTR